MHDTFIPQHLRDFPLYTEAIKFFNHSESMVRIAVRTLTLNVYKGKLTGIDTPSPFSEYMFQNMFPPSFPQ